MTPPSYAIVGAQGACELPSTLRALPTPGPTRIAGVDRNYMPNVVRELQKASPHCKTQLSTLDDESFLDGPSIPLS